ncbi:MAG: thiamine pyrophosphate-dependent dehydrogenase E1 component subunit alpha [Clostridiales bacterium]|nr:thiamine pyrophosphate-dependent dehydrogenase E1 component subunit alpha [Clostridiales bacterium]
MENKVDYIGKIGKDKLQEMYLKMHVIRNFEENIKELYKKNLCYGGMHLSVGEEGCAVGACSVLRLGDKIVTSHRGHGHSIAKGADVNRMTAELMGKSTGLCKGKGGSMHILDMSCGALGAQGIVGAQIPIAIGSAISARLHGLDYVSVSFFGEGAANTGSFHEGINMASIMALPVVFICQNNGYAVSFSSERSMKVKNVADRATAYGIPGIIADGNNIFEVYDAVEEAVERARGGEGPTLIELKTYRWYGHYVGDPCDYRTREEENHWKEHRDPIKHMRNFLLENNIFNEEKIAGMEKNAVKIIDDANKYAESCPEPAESDLFEDVYYKIG